MHSVTDYFFPKGRPYVPSFLMFLPFVLEFHCCVSSPFQNYLKKSCCDLVSVELVCRRQAFEGASLLVLSIFHVDFEKSCIFHVFYVNTAVC